MGFLLLGLGLLVAGLFVIVFAGFMFLTIILIPFAIIAGIIGLIMVIAGIIAAFAKTTTTHQTYSGKVKYCSVCGAKNAIENRYCGNCGSKFSQSSVE